MAPDNQRRLKFETISKLYEQKSVEEKRKRGRHFYLRSGEASNWPTNWPVNLLAQQSVFLLNTIPGFSHTHTYIYNITDKFEVLNMQRRKKRNTKVPLQQQQDY